MQLGKKLFNLIQKEEKKLMDLLMQKNLLVYRKDELIAKILSIKKLLNSVKTEKEKLKDIVNKKTSYHRK